MSGYETIFDPDFGTGDRALFHYGLEDETAVVLIHKKIKIHGEEWYAVSAHQDVITQLDVTPSNYYTEYYYEELQDSHLVFIVEPDELENTRRSFSIVE